MTTNKAPVQQAHPAGPVRHGLFKQIVRLIEFITWFNLCCAVIHTGQILFQPLYFLNRNLFYTCVAYTKQQFGILLTTVTQWFSPTLIRVSGDSSVRGQILSDKKGNLVTKFPERLVLIVNHQIYTEWLYLWWIAYTSSCHGAIFIILKESLRFIPVLGPAMMLYGFIFMARNWAKDKIRMQYRLQKLKTRHSGPLSGSQKLDPMWLLIFPEGTNLSANTRKRSVAWAAKQGRKDLEHLLLPRSTGLLYCLQELKGTIDYVYDCTIAYEGIRRDTYAQDFFTLRSTFLAGRPPKSVNMHWRAIPMSSIPLPASSPSSDLKNVTPEPTPAESAAFEAWLVAQWEFKEELVEHFLLNGRFPTDSEIGWVESQMGLSSLWHLMVIFGPILVLAAISIVAVAFYNTVRYGTVWGLG